MAWIPKKLTRKQVAERRAKGVRLLDVDEKTQVQITRELGISEASEYVTMLFKIVEGIES